MPNTLKPTLLHTALILALAGCGRGDAGTPAVDMVASSDGSKPMSEQQLVDEVASNLQACSYEGKPVTMSAHAMTQGDAGAGVDVVAQIMRYTGLPQNFDVIQSNDVPNAAAVILLGPDELPRRVIAYNDRFMDDVRGATSNNDWAPISIMAHEIGHHLSGHTIQPGGSQPPTELEADKFSGFVLYKMGAMLADATKAMNTLVPESDGPTHPGRSKRVRAIEEGWQQACAQQGGDCSDKPSTAIAANRPVNAPANAGTRPAPSAAPPTATSGNGGDSGDLGFPTRLSAGASTDASNQPTVRAGSGSVDVLPKPDAKATPNKFGKFVIDEIGLLDPAARTAFEAQMFALAARHQVEIVTILAKDLHGLNADDYAYAMMRQLRVGKLDVGNGAVLVMAPNDKQVGLAFGPGIMLEMRDYMDVERERLQNFLDIAAPYCKMRCNADQTEMAFEAARHIGHDAGLSDFQIRYQRLEEILVEDAELSAARAEGKSIPVDQDPTWRKLTRVTGTVISRDPSQSGQADWVNDIHADLVGPAVHVRSDDGRELLMYMNTHTEQLMVSKLVIGQKFVFVARSNFLSQNRNDTLSFDVLSFDLAQGSSPP